VQRDLLAGDLDVVGVLGSVAAIGIRPPMMRKLASRAGAVTMTTYG